MLTGKIKLEVLAAHAKGKTIVFTNGCFDLLHRGHRCLLSKAKKLGDLLVVAVNSDSSVKQLKGLDRPFESQDIRLQKLCSLQYVDCCFIFESEEELADIIFELKPDVLVKGAEYADKSIVGAFHARKLVFIPMFPGFSTSSIVKEIPKVWGRELVIVNCPLYCSKILHLEKNHRCSYHCHKIKTETFYVMSGSVLMRIDDKESLMQQGDRVHIVPGQYHTFFGVTGAQILETATQHFENDSYRLEKSK